MKTFNKNSRGKNIIKTSGVGVICGLVNTLLSFIYRSCFLYFLSAEYLGLNGLFSNILQVLSLAELGIGAAIVFRFYDPISKNDFYQVGKLMNFFRKVYLGIGGVILLCGLMLLPFLKYFISDMNDVPSDVNLYFIYILYLLQSVSSYMYAYKQNMLTADQRQYLVSFVQTGITFLKYIAQLMILYITRNFTYTLFLSIVVNIGSNYLFSLWITKQYKEVFEVKDTITLKEKKQIYEDTKACICHKIGGTVLNSTDNIIITKFVSLVATGFYSNYAMIINGLNTILTQLLGSFTSSLGNAHATISQEENYLLFKRLNFVNYMVAGISTVCVYMLIDDFIRIWVGEDMLLDSLTVIALSAQLFFEVSRKITTSYTNGYGLFVKDRLRPFVEAIINLCVSILLVTRLGIAGVFIGTIVSHLLTVFWREPYILFRFGFQRNTVEYWANFLKFSLLTVGTCILFRFLKNQIGIRVANFTLLFLEAVIVLISVTGIYAICFCATEEYKFYWNWLKGRYKNAGK